MIVKTSELEGAALDWAVCMAAHGKDSREVWAHPSDDPGNPYPVKGGYRPSTDWAQGGPLIERYPMDFTCCEYGSKGDENHEEWVEAYGVLEVDDDHFKVFHQEGVTYLIAAMRAIVAAEMGDEVDVPEELV